MNLLYVLSILSFSLLVSALSAEASLPVVFLSRGSPRHRGRAQPKSDRHCPVPTSPLQHTLQKGKSSSCSSLQSITINTLKSIIKPSLQSFLPISTNTFRWSLLLNLPTILLAFLLTPLLCCPKNLLPKLKTNHLFSPSVTGHPKSNLSYLTNMSFSYEMKFKFLQPSRPFVLSF